MTPADALEYVRLRRPRVLLAPSQWQAVQEYYNNRVSESPALQSSSQRNLPVGGIVLITETDLEGYTTSEDYCFKDEMILLNSVKVVLTETSPAVSLLEDEVLITEKDLDGYDSSSNKVSDDQRSSLFGITSSIPMVSKLCCIFSSLKFSSSSPPSGLVQEVRAC